MQILTLANLLAVALPLAAAAPTNSHVQRACNAARFNSGVYYSFYAEGSASLKATVGQTITATIVDLATCTPYTDTSIFLDTVIGSAFDLDFTYDPAQGIPASSVQANNGTNTVSFAAAVPNGSQHLSLTVTGRFTPGNLANFQFVFNKLGVVYSVA
ncbi:hypothetical protein BKA62DRAFT_113144 [Auriculariales sp. MPI-PUGE-AT-0066]|nr:hypothetical protein BKA62DRAFT_113144 [Auriculariales sp. MPI-PUGE-AT-0066]